MVLRGALMGQGGQTSISRRNRKTKREGGGSATGQSQHEDDGVESRQRSNSLRRTLE